MCKHIEHQALKWYTAQVVQKQCLSSVEWRSKPVGNVYLNRPGFGLYTYHNTNVLTNLYLKTWIHTCSLNVIMSVFSLYRVLHAGTKKPVLQLCKSHVAVALSSTEMRRLTVQLWCLRYLISLCLLCHALPLPKVSPLTRSLQFISVTVALESFLLSWPIQEWQPKWEGIKVIASHCAWIITGCGGRSTFRRV